MRSLTSLCIFLWKYTAYEIIDMVNVLHLSAKQAIPPLQENCLLFISLRKMRSWTKNGIVLSIGVIGFLQNTQFYASCISKIFTKLNWSRKRVPTIHSAELIDTPSGPPTTQTFRQRPRKKIFQEDQLDSFRIHDKINSLGDLNQSHYPPGFEVRQFEGCVIFHRLKFDIVSQVATIIESIRIDKDLHVQLQYNGIPLQLTVMVN